MMTSELRSDAHWLECTYVLLLVQSLLKSTQKIIIAGKMQFGRRPGAHRILYMNNSDLENHMSGAFVTLAQLKYIAFRDAAKLSGGAYRYMCLNSEDRWTKVNMTKA